MTYGGPGNYGGPGTYSADAPTGGGTTVTDPSGLYDDRNVTMQYRRTVGPGTPQTVTFGGSTPIIVTETDYFDDLGVPYVDELGVPYLVGD